MDIQGKKINFLGDSITEGVGVSKPENKYVEVFKQMYLPAIVRNYGISGTRFARQQKPSKKASYDQDFCSRVEMMDSDADIVVVYGGVNDHGHGDAPFGTFEDRTPDTFLGACHYLMESLLNKYPLATIVFMTPLHCIVEDREGKEPYYKYVEAIKQVAAYYAIPVLDLYTVSGIQPKVPVIKETYIPDGVHPNDLGAKRIAERLGEFIKTL
jgi:lysophospholipase L1-like esterase